ncbi:MAG: right-handed parallel beta-helix repeat-containing protein [Planctomycetota bacterium]
MIDERTPEGEIAMNARGLKWTLCLLAVAVWTGLAIQAPEWGGGNVAHADSDSEDSDSDSEDSDSICFYVSESGSGEGGLTPETAFTTLEEAVGEARDAEAETKTIQIMAGVHVAEDVLIDFAVTLCGETVITRNEAGFPNGTESVGRTTLQSDQPNSGKFATLLVTSSDVTIKNLVLDGGGQRDGSPRCLEIEGRIDPTSGGPSIGNVDIRECVVQNTVLGIITRNASVRFTGCLATDCVIGYLPFGAEFNAARCIITKSSFSENFVYGLCAGGGTDLFSARSPEFPGPHSLSIILDENEFSRNGRIGLRFLVQFQASGPVSAPVELDAVVTNNLIQDNGPGQTVGHGYAVDFVNGHRFGQPISEPGSFYGEFANNEISGNGVGGRQRFLGFGIFANQFQDIDGDGVGYERAGYMRKSTITVEDPDIDFDEDGKPIGVDFDSPPGFGNRLRINGNKVKGVCDN